MRDGFELLLLVEEDIKWIDDAAQHFQGEASQLKLSEEFELHFLGIVWVGRSANYAAKLVRPEEWGLHDG